MFKFIISFPLIMYCIKTSKEICIFITTQLIQDFLMEDVPDSLYPPPPPPFIQFLKWYSNVVFIFDSTDMVYIYQTEISRFEEKVKYTPIGDFYESGRKHII